MLTVDKLDGHVGRDLVERDHVVLRIHHYVSGL